MFKDDDGVNFNPIIVLFLTLKVDNEKITTFEFQSYYSLIFNKVTVREDNYCASISILL